MRFNKYGPLDAYTEELHPAAVEALERGAEQYGSTWLEHIHPEILQNVQHVIEIHAECRIKQALERLDYGDVDGFVEKLGSAVGYLATAVCKARYLSERDA